MKEYIEREAAIKEVAKWLADVFGIKSESGAGTLFKKLRSIPAADVVDVVRCKDCKWHQLDPWGCEYQCEKIYDVADGDLDAFYFRPSPDHFCAYGERKEENHEPIHP